jgi:glycosyltransferase involved in cell wall biosynthesis
MENSPPSRKRVLIFVVSYNAERFIESVLKRIPHAVWVNDLYDTEVLVIDDCSDDETFARAKKYSQSQEFRKIKVLFNPVNQGYGGNQKIGYFYAIEKGFDAVVLLHGDGQYAPEYLDHLIKPILNGDADAVFGSRMMKKREALKGDMPLYKWVGNQILTFLQNKILRVRLSEFHSGYRAYSTSALASIPFRYNSDYFDFDTDIIIQLLLKKKKILEVPIPTFYGEEISRVNEVRYGIKILLSSLQARVQKLGIFYHRKFDTEGNVYPYVPKFGFRSSHQIAFDAVRPGTRVLDLGSGPGFMAEELKKKRVSTCSVDRIFNEKPPGELQAGHLAFDLDRIDFKGIPGQFDTILALDIIDQLHSPEQFLEGIRTRFSDKPPEMLITAANVGFIMTRMSLLVGFFNYARRGILDLEHMRLFTFRSLKRTVQMSGFDVLREEGIPAPFPLAFGFNGFSSFCLRANSLLIRLSKSLFSYQIALLVRPRPTLRVLLERAKRAGMEAD